MLEIKMMKKVQVESRILELIKSGEYATIEIKTVDGKLSHYRKNRKNKIMIPNNSDPLILGKPIE